MARAASSAPSDPGEVMLGLAPAAPTGPAKPKVELDADAISALKGRDFVKDTLASLDEARARREQEKAQAPVQAEKVQEALNKVNAPPPAPQYTPPEQQWGGTAMLVASLGGLLSRHPLTTSLNAMAGVMKAYHEKDAEAYKQQYELWKTNHDAAMTAYKFESQAYEKLLDRIEKGGSLRELQAGMAAYGSGFKNQLMVDAALSGNLDQMRQIATGLSKGVASSERAAGTVPADVQGQDISSASTALLQKVSTPAPVAGQVVPKPASAATPGQSATPGQPPATTYVKAPLMFPGDRDKQLMWDVAWNRVQDEMMADKTAGKLETDPHKLKVQTDEKLLKAYQDVQAGKISQQSEARAAGANKSLMTPISIKYAADEYNRTMKLPPGRITPGDRAQILDAADKALQASGKTPEDRILDANNLKADEPSLKKVVGQKDLGQSFERAARGELEYLKKVFPENLSHSDLQIVNQWSLTGDKNLGGIEAPRYLAVLVSALDEYAKVLSGATGAQGTTDASRAQANDLIQKGVTEDQLDGLVDALEYGMDQKIKGYDDQIYAINKRMRGQTPEELGKGPGPPAKEEHGEAARPAAKSKTERHAVGDAVSQGDQQYRVTAVDASGKITQVEEVK